MTCLAPFLTTKPIQSPDEKTFLKHYRDIFAKSDKQIVVSVARLAARK